MPLESSLTLGITKDKHRQAENPYRQIHNAHHLVDNAYYLVYKTHRMCDIIYHQSLNAHHKIHNTYHIYMTPACPPETSWTHVLLVTPTSHLPPGTR